MGAFSLAAPIHAAGHSSGAFQLPTVAYLLFGSLLLIIGCAVTLRPVCDPHRVLIFRLATPHRVSGPGYVFVLPLIDRIDTQLDMGERETASVIQDGRTADGKRVAAQLEVTWRVDPSVRGRLSRRARATLLLSDERRVKLVDETVVSAARAVLDKCSRADLIYAGARESAMRMTVYIANDTLAPRGLRIDRVFWRA